MTDTVVLVQDRSDSIETETIEFVLIKPPTQVGEQEAENLPRRVVVDAAARVYVCMCINVYNQV